MAKAILIFLILHLLQGALVQAKPCTFHVSSYKLEWTGYKFNNKTPVAGTFENITLNQGKDRTSVSDLIKSISFEVETASLSSGVPYRDKKLVLFLFGPITGPGFIKGKVTAYDEKAKTATAQLGLNGLEKTVLFKVKGSDTDLEFYDGEIDFVKDFNMHKSFQQLSDACQTLHTGPDGQSKSWSSVGLKVEAKLSKTCEP